MSIIKRHVSEQDITPNPHDVAAKKLHDSEHAQVVHIHLAPGEKLRRHATPVDVCFYVLKGRGKVHIGEESVEVGPDTLVESPARIVHWLSNDAAQDGPFEVLVIKTPRPTSKTRLL